MPPRSWLAASFALTTRADVEHPDPARHPHLAGVGVDAHLAELRARRRLRPAPPVQQQLAHEPDLSGHRAQPGVGARPARVELGAPGPAQDRRRSSPPPAGPYSPPSRSRIAERRRARAAASPVARRSSRSSAARSFVRRPDARRRRCSRSASDPPAPGPVGSSRVAVLDAHRARPATPSASAASCADRGRRAHAHLVEAAAHQHARRRRPAARVTLAGNCQAGWKAAATPQPTSSPARRASSPAADRGPTSRTAPPRAAAPRRTPWWENRAAVDRVPLRLVAHPQLDRVHAQLVGQLVDARLQREGADRLARARA